LTIDEQGVTNDEGKDERKITSDESRLTIDEGTDERRLTGFFYFVIRQSSIATRQYLFILPEIQAKQTFLPVTE
jgi:hypothetical protein